MRGIQLTESTDVNGFLNTIFRAQIRDRIFVEVEMRMKALVHLVSSPRSDHFKCVRVYGKVQEEVESERARK